MLRDSVSTFCDLWLKLLAIRFVATITAVRGTGGALELSQQSGRSPAAKHVLAHFELKIKSLPMMVLNKLSRPPPLLTSPMSLSLPTAKIPYLRIGSLEKVFHSLATHCGEEIWGSAFTPLAGLFQRNVKNCANYSPLASLPPSPHPRSHPLPSPRPPLPLPFTLPRRVEGR